jgi:hypothetical protein
MAPNQGGVGTSVQVVEQVGRQGLRPGRRGRGKRLFGRGLYFTRDLGKALAHAKKHGNAVMVLLRCSVAMGKIASDDSAFRERSASFGLDPRCPYNSLYCGPASLVAHAWGGYVANEEFVVYDTRQAVVQEIYLLQVTVVLPRVPAKQRVSPRTAAYQRDQKKQRASTQDHLVRHHCCIKKGQVCCWATVRRPPQSRPTTWTCLCVRQDHKTVVPGPLKFDQYKDYCEANCRFWRAHEAD